jgi:Fe-S-cluster containining protein
MPSGARFSCTRCGKCCEGLVSEDKGVLRGLTLLPDEVGHFPPEMVEPAIGVGRGPGCDGFIVAYQLVADVCPHLCDCRCLIYEDRPASCRQFPFSLELGNEGPMIGLDINCPSASALLGSGDRFELPELEAAGRLYRLKALLAENPQQAWFYDLGTRKWVRADGLH